MSIAECVNRPAADGPLKISWRDSKRLGQLQRLGLKLGYSCWPTGQSQPPSPISIVTPRPPNGASEFRRRRNAKMQFCGMESRPMSYFAVDSKGDIRL